MSLTLILSLGILVSACAAALLWVKHLFASVVLLGVYSGLIAALLAALGAVDVAFTEAVVGAGVSTVLLMALVRRVDPKAVRRRGPWALAGTALVAAGLGGVLLSGTHALPEFGDPAAPATVRLSPEYARRSIGDTATPNVVTAVLADYRGFDTLIETTVILTAALACILVLGREL